MPRLQGSFGVITYSIVGVDTAPSYFVIDSQSGTVTLSRSLATDTLTEYRVSSAVILTENTRLTYYRKIKSR